MTPPDGELALDSFLLERPAEVATAQAEQLASEVFGIEARQSC